ncbi:hypothetical protein AO262_28180 [Pseudomonas fluorescens ABAC62]|nr:hypothetical protein AO262_28180 [Pseudomonas fluorescens ABAC62]
MTNALADVPDGQPNLMQVSTLYLQGVQCAIDIWLDNFPLPFGIPDELQLYINGVPYGSRISFSKPLASHTWPYTFSIPEQDIGEHGEKRLSYEVFLGTGGSEQSLNTRVTIDRLDPNARLLPEAVIFPDWVNGILTLEKLAAHGDQVEITIPGRIDPQAMDRYLFYWGFPTPTPLLNGILNRTHDALVIILTTAQILSQGPGIKYIGYRYIDRAGNNTSWPSELTLVTVVLEPAPVNLLPPRVPEAPLDLTDVQLNRAEVFIDGYDNARVGDDIQVRFEGPLAGLIITLTLTSVSFPQRVPIPWDVLRDAGGLDVPYIADVSYRIIRAGAASDYSDTIEVDVDLRSAGGNPADPGPVNPNLDLIEVESSQGLIDEIGPGDTGDATARFGVYAGALAGHRIQIYWKGIEALTPPYIVTAADLAAGQFELTIPASVIAAGGNGEDLPVWYELNNGLNTNVMTSLETPVDVFASQLINLAPIEFPDALPAGGGNFVLSCDQNVTSGIRTKILDPVNLRKDDQIILEWVVYGPNALDSTVVVVNNTFDPVVVVGDHSVPGHPGELFTVPFLVFIEPVVLGRIEARYRVIKADNVTRGESDDTIVYLTRLNAGGGVCG